MAETPPKMSLGNVATGEAIEAQYNPRDVKMAVEAFYNRVRGPGQVGEEMQFGGTGNIKTSFELTFNGLVERGPELLDVEAYLFSLLHPKRRVGGVNSGAPPLIVFSWPGWIMLVTRMPKLEQTTTIFTRNGKPAYQTYRVELETQYTRRIGQEDIRRAAFRRSE